MREPSHDDRREAGREPPGSSRRFRRRRIVVDARYQLRAGVLVGVVAVVLLVLLNVALLTHRPETASKGSAHAAESRQDAVSWTLLLLGSGVFLGGVVLVGVLESHRTAGAAYAIRRSVDELRDGRPGVRVRLRRGDHLQDLAAAVNRLAESIDAERAGRA